MMPCPPPPVLVPPSRLLFVRQLYQMTANNYWQHTLLLRCSLQGVRFEFLNLCVDLVRSYAPYERHKYYEEDPSIGANLYLAAVRQQRQQRKGERGRGEGGAEGGGGGGAGGGTSAARGVAAGDPQVRLDMKSMLLCSFCVFEVCSLGWWN